MEENRTNELTEQEEHLIRLGKSQRNFKLKYRFRSIGHNLVSDITFIALMIFAVFIILSCVSIVTVRGNGMSPTLPEKSIVVINKKAYTKRLPERGDVVATKDGRIFRVIGLPGETLELYSGSIYIDGEIVEEEYRDNNNDTSPVGRLKSFELPDNGYFLMSDDRQCYDDSRKGQIYTVDDFEGKVAFKW